MNLTPDEISHHELLALLREAIDGDRFVLCAQPIVDLATGDPIKHQLTLLLPAGDGELIGPGEFHAIAERFGLTVELDDLLIRWAAEVAHNGNAVAIDIHRGSVSDPDLARRTEQTLADGAASPSLMTFELSQESLTTDARAAAAFAQRMHDLGCGLTGNRFGTGASGFGHLKRLPLDCLKLDASFVEGLESAPSDEQFVCAFVQLARSLGLGAAADGVLDDATRAVLADAGVDQAQGPFFGDPVMLPAGHVAGSLSPMRAARAHD